MAPLPPSLKQVQPFINKAEEMKNADAIVSYYCNYWAVQCAISLGVKDPEANVVLASLLDSLEKSKTAMSTTDAITDEVVGKVYMENFAENIFAKADGEEKSRKATRTTASKFLAAAQFMEVLRCFGDLDRDTLDKIRYAKYHCARILKALKAGEDPNASSAAEEDTAVPVVPYVSPSKLSPPPAPASFDGPPPASPPGSNPVSQSYNPPPPSSTSHGPQIFNQDPPLAPHPSPPVPPPHSSLFDGAPQPQGQPPPGPLIPSVPIHPYTSSPPPPPSIRYSPPHPPPPTQYTPPPPPRPPQYLPQPAAAKSYYDMSPPTAPPVVTNVAQPISHVQPSSSSYPPAEQTVDDEAIAKAQKHARWAISALNYDDVETAIKELRNALGTLGVQP